MLYQTFVNGKSVFLPAVRDRTGKYITSFKDNKSQTGGAMIKQIPKPEEGPNVITHMLANQTLDDTRRKDKIRSLISRL